MKTRRDTVEVALGFACNSTGTGVAFARLHGDGVDDVARVSFGCRPLPALHERDAAYAALDAVAALVLRRGIRRARFILDEPELVADLAARRNVPQPLAIPYVALRCRLNRLTAAEVVSADAARSCRDLEARARAEASLDIAA
ncbi:MAG: hypothetical protein M3R44_01335 [Candidatus Eremiobacteraeota bacterium]|nr:hypothetical protein [Candidatus Eremiobacteraeota bacterium]